MCVVSMIGDHYNDKWKRPPYDQFFQQPINITRAEFEQLKKEVEEMKQLLIRAKIYDEANGEPDCEVEDKMAKLREIAKIVGIDLDEVLKGKQP